VPLFCCPETRPEYLEEVRLGPMEIRGGIRNRFHVLVLVLVTLVVGLPLVGGRVLAGHDIVTYLVYAQQTAANLGEGEVFPAWGGGFNAGYGSPALLFAPRSQLGSLRNELRTETGEGP